MVPYLILAATVCLAAGRVWRRRRRAATAETTAATVSMPLSDRLHSDVALIAAREIRERTRGRVFRVGTIIILLAVAAGIVIPSLHHSSSPSSTERVAVLGTVPAPLRTSIIGIGPALGAP